MAVIWGWGTDLSHTLDISFLWMVVHKYNLLDFLREEVDFLKGEFSIRKLGMHGLSPFTSSFANLPDKGLCCLLPCVGGSCVQGPITASECISSPSPEVQGRKVSGCPIQLHSPVLTFICNFYFN